MALLLPVTSRPRHRSGLSARGRHVDRVRILGHRGFSGTGRVENTAGAVSAALATGADGVEVDLRICADGRLLAVHDPDLNRVAGLPVDVASLSASTLRELVLRDGSRLATVPELVGAAGRSTLVLEIKSPPAGGATRAEVAAAVAWELSLLGVPTSQLTVSSFDLEIISRTRRHLRGLGAPRFALLGTPLTQPTALLRRALEARLDEIHPHFLPLLADRRVVAAAHACGVGVTAWTVNTPRQAWRLQALGVDAVITDVPDRLRASLEPRGRVGVG